MNRRRSERVATSGYPLIISLVDFINEGTGGGDEDVVDNFNDVTLDFNSRPLCTYEWPAVFICNAKID
ncbi:unnamed protein product [Thelazia callipaeda]|uniref:Uncharacterized protein n=1 Tax=Thelazia callipaeda TaxID=103827 RepID=A0A0N5CRM9_THECL|nr:unnamed protein product [Thelazia callipaeda]